MPRKALRITLISLISILAAFALLLTVSAILYSPEYIYRCLINGESKVSDYGFFSARPIKASDTPYQYAVNNDKALPGVIVDYASGGEAKSQPLEAMLEAHGTTSFIVIHDDEVAYEQYFNGYNRESICTSFSAVKSLDSLMIGLAIEEGFIQSEDQPIVDFLPELTSADYAGVTIKQLLMMRSNIRYEEGGAWFGDDAKTYYYPDLRSLALHHMTVDKDYAGQFHYNNYHPLLLGLILERSSGYSVSDYFREKIWDKVGAEFSASWSIDSDRTGFEKMESGLNFVAIDFAKIGSMLLHRGQWNGSVVISSEWLERSLVSPEPLEQGDIDSDFLKGKTVGYQYMWYSQPDNKGGNDFFAAGKFGQFLYVSPTNNVVIVRFGHSDGGVDWWPEVLRQVAAAAGGE